MPFHRFSELPPELRNHIWMHALAIHDEAALGLYRRGAWQSRQLTESDQGYDPSSNYNVCFEFDHDRFDMIPVKMALAFVNREARAAALCRRGIRRCFCEDTQTIFFGRAFRPALDTLYVPPDRWEDFWEEPSHLMIAHFDLDDSPPRSGWMTRLAIPEAVFWSETVSLLRVLGWYFSVETLLLVVDRPPDEHRNDGNPKTQRQWGVERTQKVSLVWDPQCRGFSSPPQRGDEESLKGWLERTNKTLADWQLIVPLYPFDIFSVFAVQG